MFILSVVVPALKVTMRSVKKLLPAALALGMSLPFVITPSGAQNASDILQSLGNAGSGNGSDSLTQQILRSLTQNGSQGGSQLQSNVQIQNPQLQGGMPA